AMRKLRVPIVHYHHSRWSTLVAAALARKTRVGSVWLVTFHSYTIARSLTSKTPGVAALTRWALRRFDQVIAVSDGVGEIVRRATRVDVMVIPAYLPAPKPRLDDSGQLRLAPTVIVSGCRVASRSSDDVYGLD